MFFIEWWIVDRAVVMLAVLAGSVAAIWLVRNRRKALRISVVILGSPVAMLAALFLFLQVVAGGCISYSYAVYSPDHQKAARIRTDDEGATGGNSTVEVFSKHGLAAKDVYWGEWKSVDVGDIHWISNNELEVIHDDPMWNCENTATVRVKCVNRPTVSTPLNGH